MAPRDVAGADDPPLYWTDRLFHRMGLGSHGYRFPLPCGRYRVGLHFAETRFQEPGKRRFDVLVEGRKVLSDYGPPIDRADVRALEATVDDGRLDLEFVHRPDDPQVSAIAIEAIR